MNKLYNADSAKGYEPLTDDEKDSMSDTEVEKWEAKVKDSLLRRDDSLESLISSMTTAMSKGYEVNGKTYYLTSFGISTLGYMNSAKNSMHTISMGMRMTAQLPERKTNCWQRSKKIRILWRDSCNSLQQDYMILLIRK